MIDKGLGLGKNYDWRGFRYMKKRNPCAKSKDFRGMTITGGFLYLCGENNSPKRTNAAPLPSREMKTQRP
jgi:hypothetical protein